MVVLWTGEVNRGPSLPMPGLPGTYWVARSWSHGHGGPGMNDRVSVEVTDGVVDVQMVRPE